MDRPSTPSLLEQLRRMRGATALCWFAVALLALWLAAPVHAQQIVVETRVDYIDGGDWGDDAEELTYSEVADGTQDGDAAGFTAGAQRYAEVALDDVRPSQSAIARFGPFHVIDRSTVEMIGTVDSATPRQFARMLAAHPALTTIIMRDCPGSIDEAANLALARALRRAGLSTHVPADGSVRSGAVELWMAGAQRTAAPGAEFGVHSWRDETGREARDYAMSDPVHREYLDYYREMGMDDARARQFYALTNSVGFDDLRLLGVRDMAAFGLIAPAR